MLGSCRIMKASRGVCEHLLEVLQPPIGRRQGRYEFLNAGLAWNEVFDAALLQNGRLQVEHIRQRFFAVRCCDAADRLCCYQHFFVKVDGRLSCKGFTLIARLFVYQRFTAFTIKPCTSFAYDFAIVVSE